MKETRITSQCPTSCLTTQVEASRLPRRAKLLNSKRTGREKKEPVWETQLGFGPRACLFGVRPGSQAPSEEVARIKSNADEIGGDKSKLRSANADDANDSAIDGGDDPALPQSFAEQDRTEDGQDAGDVIQSK